MSIDNFNAKLRNAEEEDKKKIESHVIADYLACLRVDPPKQTVPGGIL